MEAKNDRWFELNNKLIELIKNKYISEDHDLLLAYTYRHQIEDILLEMSKLD